MTLGLSAMPLRHQHHRGPEMGLVDSIDKALLLWLTSDISGEILPGAPLGHISGGFKQLILIDP